jgi:uncharacterized protein YjaZ
MINSPSKKQKRIIDDSDDDRSSQNNESTESRSASVNKTSLKKEFGKVSPQKHKHKQNVVENFKKMGFQGDLKNLNDLKNTLKRFTEDSMAQNEHHDLQEC